MLRGWITAIASSMLGLTGCKELNPEFQGGDATGLTSLSTSGEDESTSANEATDPSDPSSGASMSNESTVAAESTSDEATSADASSSTGDTPPPPECSMDAVPDGGACPAECNGGCVDDVCTIDCSIDGCAAQMVACPAEFACAVLCESGSA